MNPITNLPFDPDRLARYRALVFEHGKHDDPAKGYCAMEAYAMLAGETHSDHASCICPTVARMIRAYNDRVRDKDRRTRVLKDLAFIVIGTASTPEVARRREWMASDWGLRVAAPKILRLTPSLGEWADKLEALAPITDNASQNEARSILYKARDAAWAKRSEAWQRVRAAAAAAADAVADAVAAAAAVAAAVALADADAAADAVAAAAAYAVADAVAAAAAVAAAVAVADAAAAAVAPDLQRIIKAAQEAKAKGGNYYAQYDAARAVAEEVFAKRPLRPAFLALRDELDAGFVDLVTRLAAVRA